MKSMSRVGYALMRGAAAIMGSKRLTVSGPYIRPPGAGVKRAAERLAKHRAEQAERLKNADLGERLDRAWKRRTMKADAKRMIGTLKQRAMEFNLPGGSAVVRGL